MIKPANISAEFLAHACGSFLADNQKDAFLAACQRPLRKSIRVNTLKISVEQFHKKVQALGISLSPIPWCKEGFWVSEADIAVAQTLQPTPDLSENHSLVCPEPASSASINSNQSGQPIESLGLGNLASHLQGLFYIQEASSMLPPQALFYCTSINGESIKNPTKVLDLAAAPGSKTTQIAALMENSGLLLANEISASRVKSLHANLVRCGVANTCLTQFDGRKLGERLSNQFDLVLLDAPCGGEGTIRKDPKALENWQLNKVKEIAELQKQLIATAYQCVKPGGALVYSTCTLSPEENQHVAAHLINTSNAEVVNLSKLFCGAEKAVTTEGFLHIQPQIFDSEGFFVSAFIKPIDGAEDKEQLELTTSAKQKKSHKGQSANKWKSSFSPVANKNKDRLLQYYQSHFGISPSNINGEFHQKDKQIWLLPEGGIELNQLVRLNRAGIKFAEIYPNKIRTHHEFIIAYAGFINRQKVELDTSQAQDFYQGKNLDLSEVQLNQGELQQGEVVLNYQGYTLGLASLNRNKLKNLLPRDLVKDSLKLY